MATCLRQVIRRWGVVGLLVATAGCFPPALERDAAEDADETGESPDRLDTGAAEFEPLPGLTASTEFDDRIRLMWSPVAGVDGYHVYRDGERLTAGVGLTVTTYDDFQAPGADRAWDAPSELDASASLMDRVDLTWRSPLRPLGPDVTYRVVAVSNGVEGPSSNAIGRRSAPPLERFEVEVTSSDGGPVWRDTGSLDTVWIHSDPPKGKLTLDGLNASQGDFAGRVHISVRDVGVVPASGVTYRVRGVLGGGGYTPPSHAAVGRRGVGKVTFRWLWSPDPVEGFTALGEGDDPTYDDDDPPSDGRARYYRVEVQADGAESQLSEWVRGWGVTFVDLAVGSQFMCGSTPLVPDGGRVWCWGLNSNGQLGLGSTGGVHGPRRLPDLAGITKVSATGSNACALALTGEVTCWGQLARLFDGGDSRPRRIDALAYAHDIKLVGATVACASTDARLLCWGRDLNSLGLLGDGSWGTSRFVPAPVLTSAGSEVAGLRLASGQGFHLCGQDDTHLYCWGRNGDLQLGPSAEAATSPHAVTVPFGDGHPRAVAVGAATTCGLWNDELRCWGRSLGSATSTASPVLVDSRAGIRAIDGGGDHFCVLTDAEIHCVGDNQQGQLGIGTIQARSTLAKVARLVAPTALALGPSMSCALEGGMPWCWGYNGDQMLQVEATDTLVLEPSPVRFPE